MSAWIAKRNQKAAKYSAELARRILVESGRHGLRPWDLAAVGLIESNFRRKAKGKHGEFGIWQTMEREHGIENAWDWLRSNPAGFPLAKRWGAIPWRSMRHRRRVVLTSIREGAYIAAYAIKSHVVLCERMGHRIGNGRCYPTPKGMRCIRRHRYEVDRIGHFNSGWRWPKPGYLRKLRRWSKRIRRLLARGRMR